MKTNNFIFSNKSIIYTIICSIIAMTLCFIPLNTLTAADPAPDKAPEIKVKLDVPIDSSTTELKATSGKGLIFAYVSLIYRWAAGFVGSVAILIIIINGIVISSSAGDDAKLTKAKERIAKSLAGVALLFLAGVFLHIINPQVFIF